MAGDKMETSSTSSYENGLLFLKGGEYENAIAEFDKTVCIKPDHASAWYAKGIVLSKLKRYQEAIDCFDRATSIDVNFKKAWFEKGAAFDNLEEYEKAIACYDKTIWITLNVVNNSYRIVSGNHEFPYEIVRTEGIRNIGIEYVFAWIDKGLILAKLGQYQKAIECYDKAISTRSDYLDSVNQEGRDVSKSKQGPLAHYDLSILEEENYLDAWVNKCYALVKEGKFQEAEECSKKAEEISNQNL